MYNLNQKTDPELVKEVKQTNKDEPFLELYNRHIPLYTDIVNKYSGKFYASGISTQDIMEDKYVIFLNAINSYNEDKKTKFSSWLGECTKYHCLNTLYKKNDYNKFKVNQPSDFNSENQENYSYINIPAVDSFKEDEEKEQLDYLIKITEETIDEVSKEGDKRIKKICRARFNKKSDKNLSWKEVGEKVGVSYEHARMIFNNSCEKISSRVKQKLDIIK
jgi:DNA-directed RNA polymerase sigma subunit (sigma70/sigma32)